MYLQKIKNLSFDVMNYLDSKDIREFNRNLGTVFSPMEQAVLIYLSEKISVEQKLNMWHELLDTFTEEEFQQVQFMINKEEKKNIDIVRYTVREFEAALERRYDTERDGFIFNARFWEVNYSEEHHVENGFFTKFDDAFQFLEEQKAAYLEDEDLRQYKIKAEIVTVQLEREYRRSKDIYHYDNELRMIDISSEEEEHEEKDLYSVYLRPPLPFKKGDIVRTIGPEEPVYVVISYDYEWKDLKPIDAWKDSSDMLCIHDTFYKWQGKYQFHFQECYYMYLEYCPVEELPDDMTILIMLSEVYQGKLLAGVLLSNYCEYGENAYIRLYGSPGEKEKNSYRL